MKHSQNVMHLKYCFNNVKPVRITVELKNKKETNNKDMHRLEKKAQ